MKQIILCPLFLYFSISLAAQVQVGPTFEATNREVWFGWDVDINDDGTVIAISSTADNYNIFPDGSVLVYRRDGEEWTLIGDTIKTDQANNAFAFSTSLSGDGTKLAIGIPSHTNSYQIAGAVQIYTITETDLIPYPTLLEGEQHLDGIGLSVDLSYDGSTLVIGNQNPDYGRVKIYEEQNGDWQLKGNPIVSTELESFFGRDVKIDHSGNIISVISPIGGFTEELPKVEVFEYLAGDWVIIGDAVNSSNMDNIIGTHSLNSLGNLMAVSEKEGTYSNIYFYDIEDDQLTKKASFIPSQNNLLDFLTELSFSNNGQTIALQGLDAIRVFHYINEEWQESKNIDIYPDMSILNMALSENGNYIIISLYGIDHLKNKVIVYRIDVLNDLVEKFPENLKIFPNPVSDKLILEHLQSDYEIHEMPSGKKVKAGHAQDGEIKVDDLNAGFYILSLHRDKQTKTMKFVKTE